LGLRFLPEPGARRILAEATPWRTPCDVQGKVMNAQELTCLWYLRLNGYFCMPNFIAHGRPSAKTDVDVLAVRLEHSCEATFADDRERLAIPDRGVDVIFAEAKNGPIQKLNGPWARPEEKALDYVLKRVGIVPVGEVEAVAKEVYDKRKATGNGFTVRICVFAESISDNLKRQEVTFVDWKSVLHFIHERFHDNSQFKRDHCVWDDFGKYLWQNVESCAPTDCRRFFQDWDNRRT
jgi:hypothetical protein